MQKNKVLKQLLAVSAFAAMFGAFQAHAQTSSSTTPSIQELNKANTGKTNMDGKTARDGTVGNTSSQGMDERNNARNEQATSATGTSGQGSTASGTSAPQGSTGSGASPAQSSTPVGATGASDAQGSMATGGQTGAQGSSDAATGAAGQTTTDKTSTGASGSSGQDMSGQTSSGAGAAGQAGAGASGKLSKADQRAVMDMARANMAEIEAAKLALSKSQDDQVKSYAQQMIDDHTMALTEVQTLAQARGVTLPTEPDSKHKAMAAKMEKLSGDAFNREYMRQAGVADHKRVLSMLQKEQKSAKDPDVKALAAKMLPTVEQHLKAAQAVPVAKSGTTSGK
jgi:putative membrane protein